MKLKRLTAALIAAMTAVTPLSFHSPAATVFAEGTGAVSALPDWIPSDFESAVEFRNTYGATHIDNGLICIVCPDRARKGASEDTYGFELRATEGMGQELKHEIYTYEYTETCFDVFVYQPWAQGDVTLTIADPHVQVKPSENETDDDWEPPAIAEYTFTLDMNLNITETDIFSWLPDSTKEFGEYLRTNGEVSARDNYVVFCTVTVEQFGDRWEPNSTNKNEILKPILSSDCTMQVRDMYCDGSIDNIYVYQAVKDGNEKISWTRTSSVRAYPDEPTTYTMTADCAVLDNAQTVLLANTARFSIIDGETGKLVDIDENDKIFLNPDIRYASGEEGVYASVDLSAPQMTSNPYYWDISQFKDADIFEVGLLYNNIPEGYSLDTAGTVVRKFDNGAIDYTFKLKFTPTGDVNDDGEFNVADVVLLQKWLLAVPDTHLINWKAVDFCNDNVLNVFDLCLMKRELIQALKMPAELSVTEAGGVAGAQIVYRVYQEGEKKILSFADYTENRDAEPLIIQISEDEYNEIMSEAYGSYLEVLSAPRRWSEISFSITLDYADGSQKKASSDRYPSVLNKLRNLLDKYQTSPVSYVEPDERFEYGVPFFVLRDVLKLYAGPDESYDVLGGIPANTRLIETGAMNGNSTWLFTEYNGQCGWINTLGADGKMVIYFEEAPKKPVIYLYPEEETDVHIELELTEADLSTTYPKYNNGWDVTAYPDGTLVNKADGSHHKYLFWDAVNCRTRFDFSKGFCVAGSDTESFLKEKLTYMGLNEQEMNEFIVYWLPLMEHNAYNLISFQGDAYTNSAKLKITPTPDSECRVFMAYVPLENAVAIEPQQLETFERKGFSVVEWGGAEVNTFNVK